MRKWLKLWLGLLVLTMMGVSGIVAGAGQASATPGIAQLDGILNALAGFGSAQRGGAAGDSSQLIVVNAPKATDTTATLTAFERGADGSWKPVLGPVRAFVGALGIGEPRDDVYRTPVGTFALDQAFGRLPNPGTKMPYFQATQLDWWDSNTASPTYNTHVHQAASPGGDSENLFGAGPVYDYAVNIAHNPQRVPGKASAIFLHVTNNEPTQGCVAIDKETMRKVLVWLDPVKHPKISIGVNAAAPTGSGPATSIPPSTVPAPSVPGVSDLFSATRLTDLLNKLSGVLTSLLGAA
ncbi:MAG: L,D-transpeptidase family protein [Gordonia sp. (in: high G+C Gram-positive bacteria)]